MTREDADDADDRVLDQRARALAAPLEVIRSELDTTRELVGLTLGQDRFALPFDQVREIARCSAPMPLPGAAPHFVGVARVRGRLVALLDLARMFHANRPASDAQSLFVVVCGPPDDELGLIADGIGALSKDAEIFPLEHGDHSAPVIGSLADGTLLLDVARLLDDPRTGAGIGTGTMPVRNAP